MVRANEPASVRAVTRGAGLSSTSVAHHHLQKLEDMGLIEKNSYGQYVLKEKATIEGHVWVGKNLVPRLMFYSFFLIGAFIAETGILCLLIIKSLTIETSFWFLTDMTLVTMLLFLKEGTELYRKLNPKRTNKT
ncbi:MAG: hypothetical protein LBC03_05130 [Nitrososphaerota archaeon]|nr:hypothetical protein [Nitrososphaerota archaeon]